ncbi:MAG: Rieske 2Fe-2S domain-containing protein [Chloroflexi bacterium]|nr:Rieske 2Fe-2S domain-containing protein [Chloroflexota bacterium]
MLSQTDNDTISRVGPGTPMGALFRQYWLPALLSSELPNPDSDPVRVLILGEKLIAFRDTNGQVGLIQNHCPHRGASLFFGRNEEAGLRCVYHGWKFDLTGQCVDMPNEPAESNFKTKVKATAYPTHERNGIVWAYMGPRPTPPPLPDFEANQLPEGEYAVQGMIRDCNWLQALEGDIDTSHLAFLHHGGNRAEDAAPGSFLYYTLADRRPKFEALDTDYGVMSGAYRPVGDDRRYWRIAQYLFPCFVMIPSGVLGLQIWTRAWVPMDDEHCMFFGMQQRNLMALRRPVGTAAPNQAALPRTGGMRYLPNGTDWLARHRVVQHADNDYLIDRDLQRTNQGFNGYTGIVGVVQDTMVTESMGAICDRTQEHLGTTDAMIIRVRKRLLDAARALQSNGITPPGVDNPEAYRVRGGGVMLPADADWVAATEHLREAFVPHPEIDPALSGGA